MIVPTLPPAILADMARMYAADLGTDREDTAYALQFARGHMSRCLRIEMLLTEAGAVTLALDLARDAGDVRLCLNARVAA